MLHTGSVLSLNYLTTFSTQRRFFRSFLFLSLSFFLIRLKMDGISRNVHERPTRQRSVIYRRSFFSFIRIFNSNYERAIR